MMNEDDIIRRYLSPLSEGASGAFALADDAALTGPGPFVVTKDVMIGGVHFLHDDPLDLVARKLLRVSFSDLAAKGAKPSGYLLGCSWKNTVVPGDIELFAAGLKEDQSTYGVCLYGGDTTRHTDRMSPPVFSATVFGLPSKQGMVHRDGARPGDDLYVSGVIGDAGLGLRVLQKKITVTSVDKARLADRYRLPRPRLVLGAAIAGFATAAVDVSDGLLTDACRLARASGLSARIDAAAIPCSEAAVSWVASRSCRWRALALLAGFGDDYEILFSAPPELRRSVAVAAKASRTDVTRIGTLKSGEGVLLLDDSGREINVAVEGYDHFNE